MKDMQPSISSISHEPQEGITKVDKVVPFVEGPLNQDYQVSDVEEALILLQNEEEQNNVLQQEVETEHKEEDPVFLFEELPLFEQDCEDHKDEGIEQNEKDQFLQVVMQEDSDGEDFWEEMEVFCLSLDLKQSAPSSEEHKL